MTIESLNSYPMTNVKFKTFKDFAIFLYFYIAYADHEFHPMEEELIRKKIAKLFPQDLDHTTRFKEAHLHYLDAAKGDLKAIIEQGVRDFPHVESNKKYHVYKDLYDIINADGRVDDKETEAIEALKSIIEMNFKNS